MLLVPAEAGGPGSYPYAELELHNRMYIQFTERAMAVTPSEVRTMFLSELRTKRWDLGSKAPIGLANPGVIGGDPFQALTIFAAK